jgi:hypothetical protein
MSKISFGALAKAQDALSKQQSTDRKRKRGDDTTKSQEDKLEALRARLRQIKAEKMANGGTKPSKKPESTKKRKVEQDSDSENQDEDSDEADSDAAPKARSSKHAPMVQSSKRMVSRKRKVVDVKKPVFRDPRFDNMGGAAPDENTLNNRYSFLNDYRASEIAELKSTIRKTKNEGEKEKLKKKLLSMESQQKTREAKEKQQEVVRDHKNKEKELIKQGKQPFYLKKCMCLSKQHQMLLNANPPFSRAKEACPDRPLPEHEVETARQGHRAPSQEGHGQGTQEHARAAWSRRLAYFVNRDTHSSTLQPVADTDKRIPMSHKPRRENLAPQQMLCERGAHHLQAPQLISPFWSRPRPGRQLFPHCNEDMAQNRIGAAESHAHWPSDRRNPGMAGELDGGLRRGQGFHPRNEPLRTCHLRQRRRHTACIVPASPACFLEPFRAARPHSIASHRASIIFLSTFLSLLNCRN